MEKFSKFCSKRIHQDTHINVLRSNFVKFGRPEIGKAVCYLPDKKQHFIWLSHSCNCAHHAQNLPRPFPTLYSECSMFYPNRFTFGRVIAKCANTINTRHKVNPIFGWCLASSPIIILKSSHTSLAQPTFLCNLYAFFWCTHCYHSTADSTAAVSDLYCEPNHCK